MVEVFWLSEDQFERLEPILPTDTRGVARVDDRRVISGIVQVLMSGCRWKDAPACYGSHKTLYNRFVRWRDKGVWEKAFTALAASGGPPAEVLLDSTHVKAHRSAAGGKGGRAAKRSASAAAGATPRSTRFSDGFGRPLAFRPTPGNAADAPQAAALLANLPPDTLLLADKAYDGDAIRRLIETRGAVPNIPFKANRRWKGCFSPFLYKGRNAIERMFCRLKDFRRIATRYDKRADSFLAALHLAAIIAYWL